MDNVTEEIKYFSKTLDHFTDFFDSVWTNTLPKNQSYVNYSGSSIEWAHGENKDKLNPVYKDIPITYSIGERGYRVYPNYKPVSSKKIYTFGCSMTFGQSAPDQHTWPLLLAEKLDFCHVSNFGTPAAGAGEISRVCYQTIATLKKEEYPDAVFILLPETFRTEFIGNEKNRPHKFSINIHMGKYPTKESLQNVKHEHPVDIFRKSKELAYYEYTCAVNSFFDTVKSIKFIKEFLNNRNIPWFWYTWYPPLLSLKKETIQKYFPTDNTLMEEAGLMFFERDAGRDGTHAGYGYNNKLAEEFAKLYKSYETYKKDTQ